MNAPTRSGPQWQELLRSGSIELCGRMPWSSNATFLVEVRDGATTASAVYKPGAGERPLRDFPEGLWRREVAAFELSVLGGLEVVPETIARSDLPLGEGSLQRYIDADFNEHYFSLFESGDYLDALQRVAGFDLLANNADRKGGHLLVDAQRHVWAIDNGLCFHVAPKLRTVMWDFAGEALPEEVLALAARLAEHLPERLAELLHPREQEALVTRARELLEWPRFPSPDPNRRAYPWPLV